MSGKRIFNLSQNNKNLVTKNDTLFTKGALKFKALIISIILFSILTFSLTIANTEVVDENFPSNTENPTQILTEEPAPPEQPTPSDPTPPEPSSQTPTDKPQIQEPATNTTNQSSTTESEEEGGIFGNILDSIKDTVSGAIETVSDLLISTTTEDDNQTSTAADDATTTDELNITDEPTAPIIFEEQDTELGKLVTVSSPDEDPNNPHTNVLASTTIPEIYKVGEEDRIQIKWKNNGEQEMDFFAIDTDENGYLDYVEWTIPHLSTQVFEIIFISKAFYLDTDKSIVSDIYDIVRTQDGNYHSFTEGQYARVTFEKILNETKDITVYAKSTDIDNPVSLEIYPLYNDEEGNIIEGPIVATIDNITEEGVYKVLLTNLEIPTDLFDIRATGDIEIDLIVDPTSFVAVQDGPIDDGATFGNASPGTAGIHYPTDGDSMDVAGFALTATGVSMNAITDTIGGGSLTITADLTVTTITDVPIIVNGTSLITADITNTLSSISAITVNSTLTDYIGTLTKSDLGAGIENNGTITDVSGSVSSETDMSVNNNGTIDNLSGIFSNSISGDVIYNVGTIDDISGVVNNGGSGSAVYNGSLGTITNISGSINNNADGTGVYNSGGTIEDISGIVTNTLLSTGSSVAVVNDGGTITDISGVINNENGGTGIYTSNPGATINDLSGTINNSGSGIGISHWSNILTINSTVTINNTGAGIGFINYQTINGTGIINGDITLESFSTLDLSGGLTITGTLTNNGGNINAVPDSATCTGIGKGLGEIYDGSNSFPMCEVPLPTTIDSCGLIASSGTYTLTNDLTATNGSCIKIAASDVILDGGGFTISNNIYDTSNSVASIEILPGGHTGITIQNIVVTSANAAEGILNDGGTITEISATINSQGDGHGIYNSGTIDLISGTINDTWNGSGIYNDGSIGEISATVSTDSPGGGAGISNNGTITTISGDLTVETNSLYVGIDNNGTIGTISGNITNNSLATAIYTYSGSTIVLISGAITDNAGVDGGAIYMDGGEIDTISGSISANGATGDAVLLKNGSDINSISETASFSGNSINIKFYNDGSNSNDALIGSILGAGVEMDLNGNIVTNGGDWNLNILGNASGYGTLNLDHDLTVSSQISNIPLIVTSPDVTVNADIYNDSTAILTINSDASLTYTGQMENSGIGIYVSSGGILDNMSGTITNETWGDAIQNVSGGIIASISGTIINNADLGASGGSYGYGIKNDGGTITDISGAIENTNTGYGIYNLNGGEIDLISGTVVNSGGGVGIYNDSNLSEFGGTFYNFLNGTYSGLESTLITGLLINIPVESGYIWTNYGSDYDWDNASNWLGGVVPNKVDDNIILDSAMILSSNISNPVYFAHSGELYGGGLYTVDNDIYGIDGNPEYGINAGTIGTSIYLENVEFTGNIQAGVGSGGSGNANGGSVYIIYEDELDLSSKNIYAGYGGIDGGNNGDVYLEYSSLITDSNTYIYDAGTLNINGTDYVDLSGNSETCSNGVSVGVGCAWNGLFNPLLFYYNNATGDGDWANSANWWHDAEFTIQAELSPTLLNQVFIYGDIIGNQHDSALAGTIIFNATSSNDIDITVADNAIFNDESSNSGTITVGGTATFNDSSINTGTIEAATSTFYEDLSSTVGGTIVGLLQRIFTSSATSTRDFTTEGGRNDWTIISTGINTVVDLSGAIYDLATNIFKGLLGGRFIENESNEIAEPFSGPFLPQNTESRSWLGITSTPSGDVYATVFGGDIYKQTGGTGSFVAQSAGNRNWVGITSTPSGDVYAVVSDGDIYKQTGGTGSFVAQSAGNRSWWSITSTPSGDVYATVFGGDIYKQTGGTGSFVAQSAGNRNWRGITSTPNGDVYAVVNNGDIYKQTGGTGSFVAQSAGNRSWWSITSTSNGDIYATVYGGDIYKQTGGTGSFVAQSAGNRLWYSVASTPNGDVYAVVINGDIYKQTGGTGSFVAQSAGDRAWRGITSTPSGDVYAAPGGDDIYKAYNISGTGLEVVPDVTISSPIPKTTGDTTKWAPNIDWDTAISCQYSYDNYETMNTLDCAENGADLPRPTAGEHTLYIRAIDSHGGLTEKSVNYIYDNTVPTYTMCGSDLLDENRPYYYLTEDVTGPCTITATQATTTLKGNLVATSTGYTVTGNIVGNGKNINLQNITITGTVNSAGGNIITSYTDIQDEITSIGGDITISNSTTTDVISTASSSGATAGNITINTSNTGSVTANGVSGSTGGNGGVITIATSSTAIVTANGANGTGDGGNGGNITITNAISSPLLSAIFANGGSSTSCGNGGDAGDVVLTGSSYGTITANGGEASESGCPGSGKTSGSTKIPTVTGTHPSQSSGNSGNNAGNGGGSTSGSTRFNIPAPVEFNPIPEFNPFGQNFNPTNIGGTNIPNPFENFQIPGDIELTVLPVNFFSNVSNFLFAPIPENILSTINGLQLNRSLGANVGLLTAQDLAALVKNPTPIEYTDEDVPGLFIIKSGDATIQSYVTYDNTVGGIAQLIRLNSNQLFDVSLVPQIDGPVVAQYLGKEITFTQNGSRYTAKLETSSSAGRYVLRTNSSSIPLIIDVSEPIKQDNKKPWGIFNFLYRWIFE